MCFGVPMRIIESRGQGAIAEGEAGRREIDCLLIGEQPVGTHVLVHVNSAVRVLDPDEAAQIADAVQAVAAAAEGQAFEHLIADLIDREPQLPDHLKPPPKEAAE